MMKVFPWRRTIIIGVLAAAGITAAVFAVRNRTITFRGAVIRSSSDPVRASVIPGVDVVATDGPVVMQTKSDSSGGFALRVRRSLMRRDPLTLEFRHEGYLPYLMLNPAGNQLYVVSLVPAPEKEPAPEQPVVRIGNVSVRYTLKTTTTIDVGSGVKVFEVAHKRDVPCNFHPPCSPDGKWKASAVSAWLDAGPENEFRDGRVSCIAGPCPFTKIQRDDFSRGGRKIGVTVLNWSDTTTFLLQAEAVRNLVSDATQKSYPVVFERTMNFSLPAAAQGTCIEAEVDRKPIVFPIVPNLTLSWARCETQNEPENNTLYRCELRPGYAFQ
jgi:hypothetical protein